MRYYVVYKIGNEYGHVLVEAESQEEAIVKAEEQLQSELSDANVTTIAAYPYDSYGNVELPPKMSFEEFLATLRSATGNCENAEIKFYADGGGVGACAAYGIISVRCGKKDIVTFVSSDGVVMY